MEMAEDERTKRNIELKKRKHDYKGYDDDEFEAGAQGLGMKKSILAKYDEDLEGAGETVRAPLHYIFGVSNTFLGFQARCSGRFTGRQENRGATPRGRCCQKGSPFD